MVIIQLKKNTRDKTKSASQTEKLKNKQTRKQATMGNLAEVELQRQELVRVLMVTIILLTNLTIK